MPEVRTSYVTIITLQNPAPTVPLCVFALSSAQWQALTSCDVQLLDRSLMSRSLFTHTLLLKLSPGRPAASQQAVSSSANTCESASNPCKNQPTYLPSILLSSALPSPFRAS